MDKSAQDRITSGAGDNPASGISVNGNRQSQEGNRQGQERKAQITPIPLERADFSLSSGSTESSGSAAADDSPSTPDYRFARTASELLEAGLHDAALEMLQHGIRQFPDYAIGYQILGDLYLKQEKAISATFAYLEALKREPDNPLTLMKLGDLCRRAGQPAESLHYYRDALKLEPDAIPLLKRLTSLRAEIGDKNIPIEGRAPAVPASVLTTETAADLFLEQGYKEKARAIYLRLLRQSPDDERLRQKLELCG